MNAELTDTIKVVQRASRMLVVDGIAGPKTWAWIAWKIAGPEPSSGPASPHFPAPGVNLDIDLGFDLRSEKHIATLRPDAQEAARAFLKVANERVGREWPGSVAKVIGGTRSWEEQNELRKIGREWPNDQGKWQTVTNARGGESNHNFGIAFDIGIFDGKGRYIDDLVDLGLMTESAVSERYRSISTLAPPFGLSWGGNWTNPVDQPHYELRPSWAVDMSEKDMLSELRRRWARGEWPLTEEAMA